VSAFPKSGPSLLGSDSEVNLPSQIYESVRIDGNVGRLLYLSIDDTWWSDPGPAQGNFRDITFNDITITRSQQARSVIQDVDGNTRIDNIVLNNLSINGTVVTEANRDQIFEIDDTTVTVEFNP